MLGKLRQSSFSFQYPHAHDGRICSLQIAPIPSNADATGTDLIAARPANRHCVDSTPIRMECPTPRQSLYHQKLHENCLSGHDFFDVRLPDNVPALSVNHNSKPSAICFSFDHLMTVWTPIPREGYPSESNRNTSRSNNALSATVLPSSYPVFRRL